MDKHEIPLLRTSERSDFKRCQFLWWHHWVLGLSPRREPTWAWFGTAIHKGLEAWYKPGKRRAKMQAMIDAFEDALEEQKRRVYTEGGELDEDEVVDAHELGIAMLKGYVDEYGSDDEWEVIHTEQSFQIDVPHPTKAGKTIVVYAGTWDVLMRNRFTGEYWLWDHKTRKAFLKDWAYLELNDQAGSYVWVAEEVVKHLGLLKPDDRISGIVFNYLRKHMPDTRPRNEDGLATNKPQKQHYIDALEARDIEAPAKATIPMLQGIADEFKVKVLGEVSAVQPADNYHREVVERTPQQVQGLAQRVQSEALWMEQARRGKLPIYKTPTEDCPRCILFEYCTMDESDPEEAAEFARGTLRIKDVYADHRQAMEAGGISI